jgi:hypothetical protein
MLTGMTRKTSKIFVILCMGVVFAAGVSCQLHVSAHPHGMPSGGHHDHHDETSSSASDEMACIAADIPLIDRLLALSALKYDVSLSALKPLVPAFELDIPPRSSL